MEEEIEWWYRTGKENGRKKKRKKREWRHGHDKSKDAEGIKNQGVDAQARIDSKP